MKFLVEDYRGKGLVCKVGDTFYVDDDACKKTCSDTVTRIDIFDEDICVWGIAFQWSLSELNDGYYLDKTKAKYPILGEIDIKGLPNKAKRVDNGKWIYGYMFVEKEKTYILPKNSYVQFDKVEVIPETVSYNTRSIVNAYDEYAEKTGNNTMTAFYLDDGIWIKGYAILKSDNTYSFFPNNEGGSPGFSEQIISVEEANGQLYFATHITLKAFVNPEDES